MLTRKTTTLLTLTTLPFAITAIEKFLLKPLIASFSLPETSAYLLKVASITLLIFALATFFGKTYGLEISKRVRKPIAVMFLALLASCYFFLFSLKTKGFFDELAAIHLINWLITVFREEFILRGVIQTESSSVLPGSFWKISHSIWFTTFIFSIWHLVNLTLWPWQTVALQMLSCIPSGLILGVIREKTNNTLLTYLLHISGDLIFFSVHTLILGSLFFTLF